MLLKITQGGQKLDAISQNISMTGIKLSLPKPMETNLPVEIAIFLPKDDLRAYETQSPIVLKGRVVWQNTQDGRNRCIAGVEFVNLSETDRYKIQQCFKFFNESAEFESR
jgi:c-di-GMP-binding flagellar brake protein YcgR